MSKFSLIVPIHVSYPTYGSMLDILTITTLQESDQDALDRNQ